MYFNYTIVTGSNIQKKKKKHAHACCFISLNLTAVCIKKTVPVNFKDKKKKERKILKTRKNTLLHFSSLYFVFLLVC